MMNLCRLSLELYGRLVLKRYSPFLSLMCLTTHVLLTARPGFGQPMKSLLSDSVDRQASTLVHERHNRPVRQTRSCSLARNRSGRGLAGLGGRANITGSVLRAARSQERETCVLAGCETPSFERPARGTLTIRVGCLALLAAGGRLRGVAPQICFVPIT